MASQTVVGTSIPRVDGVAKATGAARYSSDLSRPGMLYGKILFSDRPHARLVKIDARRARALLGVKAVITSADAPNRLYGLYIRDRLIFASGLVRHVGEPVAAVAATSERAAAEAIGLIHVEYEDLPPVFSVEGAMEPGAPVLHPRAQEYQGIYPYIRHGNVCMEARLSLGDLDRGYAQADRIIEDTYRLRAVHQAPLEPHACLAELDHSGRLTIWTGTQQLTVCHVETAAALDLPMTEVRVIPAWLGGGFGGKLKSHLEPICALLARSTGRPVKLVLSREEEFTTTHPRAPYTIHMRTGVRNDGSIVAKDVQVLVDAGAYTDHAVGAAIHAITVAQGPYHIPNCRAHATVVYTNNPDWGCMRGYGAFEIAFATESHMDAIASQVGMDPAELRLRNLCREGEPILSSQTLRSVHVRDTMEAALEASGYWQKKGRLAPNCGLGIANVFHVTGFLSSSASVRVNEDATVSILTSITDIGTGTHTALCQIAAETLGIPVERVRIASPDSDSSPHDTGSIASRTTYDTGNAVRLAAEDVRSQMMKVAADTLSCSPEEIVWEGGRAALRSNREVSLAFRDLTAIALYVHRGPLLGHGSWLATSPFDPPVGEGYSQGPAGTFLFGTHVAEVRVDPGTGATTVLNYTACHDAGTAINPAGLEGQIQGGVVQGMGHALYEELIVQDGRILNPSLADYHLPTALDAPPITALYIEKPDHTGPFGAKGIGEAPIIAPGPAIANAVFDATGLQVKEIPITPEKLWRAINKPEGT
jgi:CO/xanthine dehydrogenase Mo-binding subunit